MGAGYEITECLADAFRFLRELLESTRQPSAYQRMSLYAFMVVHGKLLITITSKKTLDVCEKRTRWDRIFSSVTLNCNEKECEKCFSRYVSTKKLLMDHMQKTKIYEVWSLPRTVELAASMGCGSNTSEGIVWLKLLISNLGEHVLIISRSCSVTNLAQRLRTTQKEESGVFRDWERYGGVHNLICTRNGERRVLFWKGKGQAV